MSYVKPSLISKSSGSAENKSFEVIVMDVNDIASFPVRNANGVTMVNNYVMKTGKYITKIQVSTSKTSLPVTSEGEEDNVSISSLPEFSVPGSSLDFEEFVANWTNKSVIVGVQVGACGGGSAFYRMFGSQCAPLSLLLEGQNNNDATMNLAKFQQFAKTNLMPGRYTGTFTLATVTDTVAADATVVDATDGQGEYQLTVNTTATIITDITNAVTNGKYTLLGSGGAEPATIENGGNFHLAGGVDWQGLAGDTITFNALDAGSADHFFVETSRT
ncbi:hypothetical protein ES692_06120 [Psychroserpens burtonensis]|uniref:Uncharacterized protein n=1 Tax=Psychroserpens burtonensis TaxID=49278 RepID=A0A5C7BAE4_9FLAO|nr:hypothetical protein [Psychroserpens burtonensis]TXE18617.1 hypothetical protein ES692_06120 [Psychroserpens burtonensis]